jgi:anti-sigma regulatory factor (Ser/Thr protein kinase)
MTLRLEAAFKHDPESVKAAREFVAGALAAWDLDDLAEVAGLLTSELATNAVVHARTAYHIAVEYRPPELLVEVHDGSRRLPVPRRALRDRKAANGWGLLIVEGLADRWGSRRERQGKNVWFALVAQGRDARPDALAGSV